MLKENLSPDETVRVIIRGTSDSSMIATDRRIFVFKKGWLSGSALGKKLSSYDYANITGIQVETGKIGGTVVIQAAGVPTGNVSYWGKGKDSAQEAPNALAVVEFEQAHVGGAAIRQLIAEHQTARLASQPSTPNVIEQIRQLGELRAAGIITDEEFETKKAELLSRI